MYIHIRELMAKNTTVNFDQTLDLTRIIKGRPDITSISPVQVQLTIRPELDGVIHVQGELTAQLEMNCSRCLTSYSENVVTPFDDRFKHSEHPEQDEEEDLEFELITGEKLDLEPYLEEAMYMSLPYVPLCNKDCKGLCPTCGHDRNDSLCGCSNEKIDPRLAGLKDLFFKK